MPIHFGALSMQLVKALLFDRTVTHFVWMIQPPERLTEGQTVTFQLTKAPWALSKTETQKTF